jgi:predicted metal-dependent hydrolase
VPGKNPHPRRDPRGHSYGKPEPTPSAFQPEDWHQSEEYLYGIDLYNFAYWWECHEAFEGFWHAVGHDTEQGNFFQALIQLAAANLKLFTGNHQAAGKLLTSGIIRLQKTPRFYMGIDVAGLNENLRRLVADSDFRAPLIRLNGKRLA